jgi:hypothetical protein
VTTDATKQWLENKDTWTELTNMNLHEIKTLLIPTDDEDVITIHILKTIDGWAYWSDDTNLNVFVPDNRED